MWFPTGNPQPGRVVFGLYGNMAMAMGYLWIPQHGHVTETNPRKKRTKRTDIPIISSDTCGLPEKVLSKQQEMWKLQGRVQGGLWNKNAEMTMKSDGSSAIYNMISYVNIYIYI